MADEDQKKEKKEKKNVAPAAKMSRRKKKQGPTGVVKIPTGLHLESGLIPLLRP